MYIYKITNKSTHQCYIGQTKSFIKRWEGHCRRNETPIQKAIKKEGITNFTFEVLEECLEEKADERECYWIEYKCPRKLCVCPRKLCDMFEKTLRYVRENSAFCPFPLHIILLFY